MASGDVRIALNQAIADAAAPTLTYDLSDFVNLEDCLSQIDSEAVLIQYTAVGETVASIGGEGNQGWEQTGSVVLHYMVPTGFDSGPTIIKCDDLRVELRGTRVTSKLIIESCEPFTDFGGGSEGLYGAAWHGWASNLFYVRRDCG